jgi:hypothetical protein
VHAGLRVRVRDGRGQVIAGTIAHGRGNGSSGAGRAGLDAAPIEPVRSP